MGNYLDKGGVTTLVRGLQSRFGAKNLMDTLIESNLKFYINLNKNYVKKGTTADVSMSFGAQLSGKNANIPGMTFGYILDELDDKGNTTGAGTTQKNVTSPQTFAKVAVNTRWTLTANFNGKDYNDTTVMPKATLKFVYPSYVGVVAENFSITAENLKALGERIDGRWLQKSFTLNNQKVVYAFQQDFGALGGIKYIEGNMDSLGSFDKTEVTIDNVKYWVYLSKNAATGGPFTYQFL